MATIPDEKLAELRRMLATRVPASRWRKSQVNAALQACENWFVLPAVQTNLNGALNNSVSGFTLTPAERLEIKRAWLLWRAEGVE
jgi:hypothetical protein